MTDQLTDLAAELAERASELAAERVREEVFASLRQFVLKWAEIQESGGEAPDKLIQIPVFWQGGLSLCVDCNFQMKIPSARLSIVGVADPREALFTAIPNQLPSDPDSTRVIAWDPDGGTDPESRAETPGMELFRLLAVRHGPITDAEIEWSRQSAGDLATGQDLPACCVYSEDNGPRIDFSVSN